MESVHPDEDGDVYMKLRQVMTVEQLHFLADTLIEIQRAAKEHHADQQIIIVFNDKGYPRHLNRWVGSHFPSP